MGGRGFVKCVLKIQKKKKITEKENRNIEGRKFQCILKHKSENRA